MSGEGDRGNLVFGFGILGFGVGGVGEYVVEAHQVACEGGQGHDEAHELVDRGLEAGEEGLEGDEDTDRHLAFHDLPAPDGEDEGGGEGGAEYG